MKGRFLRIAVILAILVAGMSMAAVPGAAQVTIASAELCVYREAGSNTVTVNVHQVTEDWTELGVNWYNRPGYSGPVTSFASGTGWLCVDVTTLVQAWAAGTANYGVLLEQGMNWLTRYSSREGANDPYLWICTSSGCQASPAVADAYVWELNPYTNYGSSEYLFTGVVLNKQKQSLIKFEIPDIPTGAGCTPGYWKQEQHLESWGPTGYTPEDIFFDVFGVDLGYATLWDAVNAKGGGVKALARHGTAALLSAAHPDVGYPISESEVIALVQAGDKDTLAMYNELGCPLD